MNLPVEVNRLGGDAVHARVLELSRSGVRLAFREKAALGVFPDGAIRSGAIIASRLQLPAGAVVAESRVVWSDKMGRDEYHVGCAFTQIDEQGYDHLVQYLAECLAY